MRSSFLPSARGRTPVERWPAKLSQLHCPHHGRACQDSGQLPGQLWTCSGSPLLTCMSLGAARGELGVVRSKGTGDTRRKRKSSITRTNHYGHSRTSATGHQPSQRLALGNEDEGPALAHSVGENVTPAATMPPGPAQQHLSRGHLCEHHTAAFLPSSARGSPPSLLTYVTSRNQALVSTQCPALTWWHH